MNRFSACFSDLDDPRAENALHDLTEILFIALLATLCGATSCSDMEEFGLAKEPLLRKILRLQYGIPSHDTFSRVFRLLDREAFEEAFRGFMAEFAKGAKIKKAKGVVALDGKALRGAYERGESHMPRVLVTAWGAQTRMSLASTFAVDRNETKAALQLIELLQLKECVVTADAAHGHRAMAEAIVARGGDYVLAVKGNQEALLADAVAAVTAAGNRAPRFSTKEEAHGRKEQRTAVVVPAENLSTKHNFPGLKAVACVVSRRGSNDPIARYFLLSKTFPPDRLLDIVRAHWSIENGLHWVLDVVLDEDLARSRKDHAPENLALLRRLALNVVRAHPDTKTSLRRKLLRAGWDEAFLLELIEHMR